MVGRIRRKIVAVVIFVVMMPVCMQAVVIPDKVVQVGAAIPPIISSIISLAQLSNGQGNPLAIFGVGAALGSALYFPLREWTPSQILKRAQEAIEMMHQGKLKDILPGNNNITIDGISTISTAGGYPLVIALQEAKKYDQLFTDHLQWLKPLDKNLSKDVVSNLTYYGKRIGQMNSVINHKENSEILEEQRRRLREDSNDIRADKIVDSKVNESKASITTADAKFYTVALKYWKWILSVVFAAPILLRVFVWTSRLPYPH